MNPIDESRWKSEVLDQVLHAFALNEFLRKALVFKGARVLNLYLPHTGRQSLDIDSNLSVECASGIADTSARADKIRGEIEAALTRYFRGQAIVKYALEKVKVESSPAKGHPLGWDALAVRLTIRDLSKSGERVFPALTIDIAAPESLSDKSVQNMDLDSGCIRVYSLERIAGEKLRAYLSSLGSYRTKIGRPGEAIRVKDIYDIARILQAKPIPQNDEFWRVAAAEFRLCCETRYVDCSGIESFRESLELAKSNYQSESVIPKDLDFNQAWNSIEQVLSFFQEILNFPWIFELPAGLNSKSSASPS